MYIVHFDVDDNLKKYLGGKTSPLSIRKETVSLIPSKEKIETMTIKSQSVINEVVLKYFPKLRLIITRTVGTDHIDLEVCKKRGITVFNISDYGAYNVAEHTMALLLAGARNIIAANNEVHQGKFSYSNFLGKALKGKTLGMIGTGKIGLEVIKRAKAFELKIIAYDVYQNKKAASELEYNYVSLNKLLKTSDFISLHVPLLNSTYHMIGEKEIKLMKDNVILVNTARGEIIDTKALIKYIKKFKAVCLDVVEGEQNFSKNYPLLKYENVIVTPHIGFYTDDSIEKIAQLTEECIKNFLAGNNKNRTL